MKKEKKVNLSKEEKKKLKEEKKLEKKERKSEKKKNKPRKKFRFFYWLMVLIVIFALLCFIGGVGFCYYIVKGAPEFNVDNLFEKEASRIFDSQGNLMATLGEEQRQKVTYDELPQVLIDAIIATEDSRFFQHNGFDAPRFLKASIQQVLGRGGGGASTLTMQLAKLAFTDYKLTEGLAGIIRKFTDIYIAVFKMEKNFTKEEIIEYYVNTPCLGGNIYGVQQASKHYFGKDVKDLNLVEAAQIAGMFQSPNGYNPFYNPNDANDRKNTVLYLMKRHGYITDTEYKAATSIKIKDMLKENDDDEANPYQGFIDTVVQELKDDYGLNPYSVSMDVYTTMNKSKQDAINNFYKTYKFKDKKIEVGIGVVDNDTGAILAVGAGRNKSSAGTLNVATFDNQIKRAPGSTIKPILDYGPAIEYENLSTYGPFIDEKTPYGTGNMRNFNSSYKGFMTMRDCLKNSINTCALQAFRLTSAEDKIKFAKNLGIEFKDGLNDAYSIGAFNGVSPVQLAAAYAAFGNGGTYHSPHSYTKFILRETGEEFEKEVTTNKNVMSKQTAYIITSILTSATSSSVKVSGTQIATKTGTTSYDTNELKKYGLTSSVIPDSWTSSYTPDYAMAIWYGYTDGLTKETVKNKYYLKNAHATSERIKIQAALAKVIYEKNSKFKNPGGITTSKVELETIPPQLPSEYTPSKLVGTFMFKGNTAPTEVSNRFDKLKDPISVQYNLVDKTLNLSWTSPGIPDAVNIDYLTEYFKNGYTIWADDYLKKRLKYNSSNIGEFGFDIYLTQGTNSTYVGWTKETSYTIDTSKYTGVYDGVIVKSAYSKFKNNASDGYKAAFSFGEEVIDPNNITVTMNGLTGSFKVNDLFTELNTNNIETITYNGTDIKNTVTDLIVIASSIVKDGSTDVITKDNLTSTPGTYKITYTVTFNYKTATVTKTFTQTIVVQ